MASSFHTSWWRWSRGFRSASTSSSSSASAKSSTTSAKVHIARESEHLWWRERWWEAARSRKEAGEPTGRRHSHSHHTCHHGWIHSWWHAHHVGRHSHHTHPAHIAAASIVKFVLFHHAPLLRKVVIAVILLIIWFAFLYTLFRLKNLNRHARCWILSCRLSISFWW